MEMMRVVGLGLVAAALIVVVRQQRPEMGLMLSLVAGLLIFGLVLGRISDMLDIFQTLASKAEVNLLYLGLVIKILGITYLAEFGIQICKDAGENAIASKIEFAGKVFILVLSMPLLGGIFDFIVGLIP